MTNQCKRPPARKAAPVASKIELVATVSEQEDCSCKQEIHNKQWHNDNGNYAQFISLTLASFPNPKHKKAMKIM
jgi:hypothetical protein